MLRIHIVSIVASIPPIGGLLFGTVSALVKRNKQKEKRIRELEIVKKRLQQNNSEVFS
jgi:hypothetical protein